MGKKNSMGKAWAKAREGLKLNKSEFAKALQVSPAYITLIESGQRTSVSMDVLKRAAALTGATADQLMGT